MDSCLGIYFYFIAFLVIESDPPKNISFDSVAIFVNIHKMAIGILNDLVVVLIKAMDLAVLVLLHSKASLVVPDYFIARQYGDLEIIIIVVMQVAKFILDHSES